MAFGRDLDIGFPNMGATHVADAKTDYASPGLDTEAEVIVAVNATNTKLNSVIAACETAGIIKTA